MTIRFARGPAGPYERCAITRMDWQITLVSLTLPKRDAKRDLYGELAEGFTALREAREGKRTLRTHSVEFKPAPDVSPKDLIQLRETRNISRGLFARYLRTNPRTFENWEQGRAKPNAQAALLINLVMRYPDTVERLASI